MTIKRAIQFIEDYLYEPSNISDEWVEVLLLCLAVLKNNCYELNQKFNIDGE